MTKIKNRQQSTLTKRLSRLEAYVSTHKGELKARPAYTALVPTIAGDLYLISGVPEDDTKEGRTGEAINLQQIEVNTRFVMTKTCQVRIIVFRDKQYQGGTTTVTDVLDSADMSAPYNYTNLINMKRFVIIDDYIESFTTGGKLTATKIKKYIHPVKVRYAGTTVGGGVARQNNIFVIVIADTATAGDVTLYNRVVYTDE
jgi:hypothetical protein